MNSAVSKWTLLGLIVSLSETALAIFMAYKIGYSTTLVLAGLSALLGLAYWYSMNPKLLARSRTLKEELKENLDDAPALLVAKSMSDLAATSTFFILILFPGFITDLFSYYLQSVDARRRISIYFFGRHLALFDIENATCGEYSNRLNELHRLESN